MGESSALTGKLADIAARKGAIGRGVGIALDVAFVILCAWLLARLFWYVLTPAAFVDVPVANTSARTATSQSADFTASPAIFRSFNPFTRTLDGQIEAVEEEAPQTTLNLSIRSVFAFGDSEQSFVRIHTPDNEVRRYYEGDTVVSGVSLEQIQSDRVILLRNGVRETLYLNERNAIGRNDPERAAPTETVPQPGGAGSYTVSAEEWSFEQFYRDVTIRRVVQPDRSTVLQIQGTSNAEGLARVGLRVNDKLITVNGYDMSDESLSDLYDVFREANRFDFEVERNGQIVPIRVSVGE